MKLTLDRMCIQTDRLCTTCNNLFEAGEISEIDIAFGKILLNAAKSQKFLSNITIQRFIETGSTIFIIIKKGDKEKLQTAGDNLLKQFRNVDKRIIVYLEKTKSVKKLLEELIGPEMVVTTSTVFLPPFSEKEIKVQVKKDKKKLLRIKVEDLSRVTNALLGMNMHFTYI